MKSATMELINAGESPDASIIEKDIVAQLQKIDLIPLRNLGKSINAGKTPKFRPPTIERTYDGESTSQSQAATSRYYALTSRMSDLIKKALDEK